MWRVTGSKAYTCWLYWKISIKTAETTERFQYLHQLRSQGFRVRTSEEKRKPWSGPVTWHGHVWQLLVKEWRHIFYWKIQVFETNKQPKHFSIDRYYLWKAKFGTNQLKSLKTPSMFSKIYGYFWRFSTTVTGKVAKCTTVSQHDFQSRRLQVAIHTRAFFNYFPVRGHFLKRDLYVR